jgi:hypothetical protein
LPEDGFAAKDWLYVLDLEVERGGGLAGLNRRGFIRA